MTQVEHFGLHFDGPVGWLLQGRGGSNFVGLSKKCPFENPKGMCNHLIPTAAPIPDKIHWETFRKLLKDPLVRAMLPIPNLAGSRAFYIEDRYDDLSLYLNCLSRLTAPIKAICKPAWMLKTADLQKELSSTNVQPLVITQMDTKSVPLLNAIAKSTNYLPRTVIVTGSSDVPIPKEFQKLDVGIRDWTVEDLVILPFENLGATSLRRFVRKEKIDDPIETRDERRDRIIRERIKDDSSTKKRTDR